MPLARRSHTRAAWMMLQVPRSHPAWIAYCSRITFDGAVYECTYNQPRAACRPPMSPAVSSPSNSPFASDCVLSKLIDAPEPEPCVRGAQPTSTASVALEQQLVLVGPDMTQMARLPVSPKSPPTPYFAPTLVAGSALHPRCSSVSYQVFENVRERCTGELCP